MHDRYLSAGLGVASTNAGIFHWHKAIALFNNKLSGQVLPEERDALWGVAAFLGILALYYIEAKTPDEAWPLKPPSSLDLNWLKLSDGKKAVWAIADPLRDDSIFRPVALSHLSFRPGFPAKRSLYALPPEIIEACGLGTISNLDNNEYYGVALSLAQVIDAENVFVITMSFLSLISNMRQYFLRSMQVKDPRALLLMACWYAKVSQCQLWSFLDRATLESQSICTYLERNHGHEVGILKALKIPRLLLCPMFERAELG
ncbi:MAG: hypothetical protein OHK93_000301 [Ramalina farinacea]|uniref:Uncharacterized protein n=1 Tax=Ramalina farinacea TaxID=258253 RepID=A0AA43QEL8_9LECA|nr:hypothetical protein [Ramalina farinacea]